MTCEGEEGEGLCEGGEGAGTLVAPATVSPLLTVTVCVCVCVREVREEGTKVIAPVHTCYHVETRVPELGSDGARGM